MKNKYDSYQDMDLIMQNRRYFLNNISEKYGLTDDDFIDINKIDAIIRENKIDAILSNKKMLSEFVENFYKWHEEQKYAFVHKKDWIEYIESLDN